VKAPNHQLSAPTATPAKPTPKTAQSTSSWDSSASEDDNEDNAKTKFATTLSPVQENPLNSTTHAKITYHDHQLQKEGSSSENDEFTDSEPISAEFDYSPSKPTAPFSFPHPGPQTKELLNPITQDKPITSLRGLQNPFEQKSPGLQNPFEKPESSTSKLETVNNIPPQCDEVQEISDWDSESSEQRLGKERDAPKKGNQGKQTIFSYICNIVNMSKPKSLLLYRDHSSH
jgi:hypothetical protein